MEELPEAEKEKVVGWHYPQQNKIQLTDALPAAEFVSTYLHEIFHALFSVAPPLFSKDKEGEEHEERVVDYLGNALTQVLRDNPETIQWMLLAINAKQAV